MASSAASSVYRLGEFFVLQFPNLPICVAEIQLAWEDTIKHDKLLSLRLYFRPEDTPNNNRPSHQYGEVKYYLTAKVTKLLCSTN